MSKLYNYLCDLHEQRENLICQVAELDMNSPVEIGSDADADLATIAGAISDLDEAIAQIEGHA